MGKILYVLSKEFEKLDDARKNVDDLKKSFVVVKESFIHHGDTSRIVANVTIESDKKDSWELKDNSEE